LQNSARRSSRGRRYRRLGVERVEDRCLLAAVVFQTGMEAQLMSIQGEAASAGSDLIIVSACSVTAADAAAAVAPSGATSSVSSAAKPPRGTVWTDAAANAQTAVQPGGINLAGGTTTPAAPPVVTPNIVQSPGGSETLQPIVGSDLPPAPVPPALAVPLPNPTPAPVDIGQIFKNPPPAIQDPIAPPESIAAPAVVGNGPSTAAAPSGVAAKPDVEGNCGKSQLIDVASSQVPQADAGVASLPGAMAEVSFNDRDDRAMPTTNVDGLIRETARGDQSGGQADSSNAFTADKGSTAADRSIVDAPADASDTPGTPSPAFTPDRASVAPDLASANGSSTLQDQAARLEPHDAAGDREVGGVSAPLTTVSDLAAAGSLAVADRKPEETAGKPLAVENYYRADIAGFAVLAVAGEYLARRWPRPAPVQPRPIALRRQKPPE
jgi:hypothetical protein